MKGNGIDIIEIGRIAEAMKRRGFLERIFTPSEREYFAMRGNHPATVAGVFAAKEAASKALGTGIRGFRFVDLEVLPDALGKPSITMRGTDAQFLCSISHSRDYAVASVILL